MGTTVLMRKKSLTSLDELSDKQKAFVVEYVKDFDSTRSARSAGYKHPSVSANSLLKQPKVRRAVASVIKEGINRCQIEKDEILYELYNIITRDIIDLCDEDGNINISDVRDLPPEIRRCIDGIKCKQTVDEDGNVTSQQIELKLVPKLPAMEMVMKHLGMLAPAEQNLSVNIINWDDLYGREETVDTIEARIIEEQNRRAK